MFPHRKRIRLDWTVGHSASMDAPPERRVPATVPGAVQMDIARAEGWPDWNIGRNYRAYRWMEDRHWHYRAVFPRPALEAGTHLHLVAQGIDYAFVIRLNGKRLHEQEGMFTPVDLRIDALLAEENELEIVVLPAPKAHAAPEDKKQAARSCKPAVSYGWDWHPRLVPLGIWDEAFLEVRPAAGFTAAEVRAEFTPGRTGGEILVTLKTPEDTARVRATVTGPTGGVAAREEFIVHAGQPHRLHVPGVRPWYPAGYGAQDLYRVEVALLDAAGRTIDLFTRRVGFRCSRLVANEGWENPGYPKSRDLPPFTLEINGRRVFAKGSNWVNPEIFWGAIDEARYRELLVQARDAHFNILRVWGGSIVNKEAFHDLCDELGLMVWQEFPLACNRYPDDPGYLAVLEQEAGSIVRRLRPHPSTVLWSGGNELFNAWSGMDDQSLPLRLLNAVTYRLSPEVPFIPTSPVMGVGHGHYVFRDPRDGREAFQFFVGAEKQAYTEFGCPGLAHVETIERIIPKEERWPPRPDSCWRDHHAFEAWAYDPASWGMWSTLEHYFGPLPSLEQAVAWSQLLQAEGYRCLYEEARRQKPRCSMALNWCFNEPWPGAAGNNLVAYPARPKPALAAVAEACRPVLASARIPRMTWRPGERFEAQLFVLNDGMEAVPGARVQAVLEGPGLVQTDAWDCGPMEAGANAEGPAIGAVIPADWPEGTFRLLLDVKDRPEWNSAYTLLLR